MRTLALGLAALCACARPHLLLITLDTTRADHLGCYGYPAAQTPVLDSLAARGTRFAAAFTPVPLTLPAHASMMTGLYPWEHGVRDNGTYRLADTVAVLASLLAEQGYHCVAVIGAAPLAAQYGLARGFHVYDDALRGSASALQYAERPAFEVTSKALAHLQARPSGKPLFVWVHYFDPHAPYAAPRGGMSGYDVEIARVDHAVGRLLSSLPAGDWSVLVVGDHGEGLGEHGEETHGDLLYQSTLRVPFIGAGVGWRRGRVRSEPVSVVDVYATLLGIARVRGPATPSRDVRGRIPTMPLRAETLHPLIRYGWPPLRSVQVRGWKLIQGEGMELYQVAADPGETSNLAASYPETVSALARLLPPWGALGPSVPLDPGQRAALEALGYFPRSESLLARDRLLSLLEQAHALAYRRDWARAAQVFREVVSLDPGNVWARMGLGACLASMGSWMGADSAFRAVLRTHPTFLPALQNLAMVRLYLGDDEEAQRLHQAVLSQLPDDPTSLEAMAVSLRRQGRFPESLQMYERLARVRPWDAKVLRDMGSLLAYELGDRARAARLWRQALDLDPHLPQRAQMERELRRWGGG